MFKIYSHLTKRDYVIIFFIIGLTILQVYASMSLIDFLQGIIKNINFLDYHNNPGHISGDFLTFFESNLVAGTTYAEKWSSIASNASAYATLFGISESAILSVANASLAPVLWNGGMMLLCAVGTALCQFVISALASVVAANLATRTRSMVNNKVSNFSLAEINHFSTASLITRTTNDIENVQMTSLLMMRMVFAAPVTAIWALYKINASSPELTYVTLVGIVIMVVALFLIMCFVTPKFKVNQRYLDNINGLTRENLNGIRVVRAYNAEDYQTEKFDKANKELTKVQIFTGRVLALLNPLLNIVMNGLSLAIYWVGAVLINKGTIDYATVTAFMMLSTQIVMSFVMLLMMFIMWPRASVSAKRINEVLEMKDSILDPAEPKVPVKKGTLAFKNVSFSYPDADYDVLSNISFSAKEGDTIAFIGSTGSGKSTLVNLVTRLYDVTKGEVDIDGVNVKDLQQETLRKLIGFVPQRGLLFSGTVKSNIAFGNPNASDEDIKKAAHVASADTFIEEMEGAYEAPISQGGTNVSGGQRQRLCIARAVCTKPEFIVFDDSFSALDYKTDKEVREKLKEELSTTTKLIVAQRIGTIMDADEIVVLDEGKIVGTGTHKELLASCPIYRQIALSQLSKEELGL